MPRRKRYIKWRIFKTNDKNLTGHHKPGRRVVAVNNDPKNMHVKRITKKANGGRNAKHGIPIEKYPDVRLESVVENKTFRHKPDKSPLRADEMGKTNSRLNKWDQKKLQKK